VNVSGARNINMIEVGKGDESPNKIEKVKKPKKGEKGKQNKKSLCFEFHLP
jgi:hypothetical protein